MTKRRSDDGLHSVILYKDGVSADITDLTSELSWNESKDTVGASVSLSVPDIENKYITRLLIAAGDIIVINNDDGELFRCVAVQVTRQYPKRSVKAYDYGFYINKNEVVIQFSGTSVSESLKLLFEKVGIAVGSICDMPAEVNKVYIDNVKKIIDDLIEIQTGNDEKNYYYELRGSAIYVFELSDEPIDYIFKPTTNIASFDVTSKNAHGRGKYTHSIEDMKNRVTAIVNSKTSGELPAMEYTVSDTESISKYGLLGEKYKVDSDDSENIKSLAENELKEKNKLKRELTMDFVGHDSARPGRVMHVADEYLGIDDYFRIKTVKHTISGGLHTMNCTLEYVKENTDTSSYAGSDITVREEVTSGSSSSFISALKEQVGKPYVWGASGPDSFDCSGLIYYCLNQSGTSVSRLTAQGFYNSCTKISESDRQPGDLIFWANNGSVYHVAAYIGDGYMIGAQTEDVGVAKMKVYSGVYAYGRL